jgi:hypothetical protein
MHIAKNNNKQSIMNLLMQYGARGLDQHSYNEMVPLQNI